jgi:putative DNA primase/helicase
LESLLSKHTLAKDYKDYKDDLLHIERYFDKYNNTSFVNGIMTSIYELLKDESFNGSFDSSVDEIAIKDGLVLNLRTLKSHERTQKDYFTSYMNLPWDKKNEGQNFIDSFKLTPDMRRFFSNICLKSKSMIRFLQYILGNCLTNDVNIRSFFLFYGCGANGKSLVMLLMEKILGDYYHALDESVVVEDPKKSSSSASPHIHALKGKKMVVYPEFTKGDSLNEGLIKSLTGKDKVSARGLYGNPINFSSTFKIFILSNHFPNSSLSTSILDRLVIFPFDARFVDDPKEKNEFKKNKNADDILSTDNNLDSMKLWLIIGAYRSLNEDMEVPRKCKNALKEYIKSVSIENNRFECFYKEIVVPLKKKQERISATELFHMFGSWCEENNIKTDSQKKFGCEMSAFLTKKKTGGINFYLLT